MTMNFVRDSLTSRKEAVNQYVLPRLSTSLQPHYGPSCQNVKTAVVSLRSYRKTLACFKILNQPFIFTINQLRLALQEPACFHGIDLELSHVYQSSIYQE